MYSFNHSPMFRPAPHSLPPAGMSKDAGHLTAADCLCSIGDNASGPQLPAPTTYQQQCSSGLQRGPGAPVAPAGARRGQDGGGAGACLKPGPAAPHLQQLLELKEANYQR
jgi:hypothetical protein